jgi:hypothetical protein
MACDTLYAHLFAQDVFAGIQGVHGVLVMISVWGTDVNDVYFGIGEYLLISTTLGALLKVRGEDSRDELFR